MYTLCVTLYIIIVMYYSSVGYTVGSLDVNKCKLALTCMFLKHTHAHTTHMHTHTHTHTHTGQYPQINDDLVNSHHLLLCCMDMLFCAAVEGKRRDLLNPECAFLPGDFSSPNFVCSDEKMCILTELATTYGGIYMYIQCVCVCECMVLTLLPSPTCI